MKDNRLNLTQAGQLLGVPPERIRAWCEEGRFPSYRSVGGRRKIDRAEIIAFARKHPELVAPPKGRSA